MARSSDVQNIEPSNSTDQSLLDMEFTPSQSRESFGKSPSLSGQACKVYSHDQQGANVDQSKRVETDSSSAFDKTRSSQPRQEMSSMAGSSPALSTRKASLESLRTTLSCSEDLQSPSTTCTSTTPLLERTQRNYSTFQYDRLPSSSSSSQRNSHASDEIRRSSPSPSSRRHYSGDSESREPLLTHLNNASEAHMVSIAGKVPTRRLATAVGHVRFSSSKVVELISSHSMKKGDVFAVARTAGLMAVKRAPDLIPLCHPGIQIEGAEVLLKAVGSHRAPPSGFASVGQERGEKEVLGFNRLLSDEMEKGIGDCGGVRIACTVECDGKTGVEMEALVGVTGAALTIVDMCKSVDKMMSIQDVRVVKKQGGRSGDWSAQGWE